MARNATLKPLPDSGPFSVISRLWIYFQLPFSSHLFYQNLLNSYSVFELMGNFCYVIAYVLTFVPSRMNCESVLMATYLLWNHSSLSSMLIIDAVRMADSLTHLPGRKNCGYKINDREIVSGNE